MHARVQDKQLAFRNGVINIVVLGDTQVGRPGGDGLGLGLRFKVGFEVCEGLEVVDHRY